MTTVAIDADLILFKAAAAGEKRSWLITNKNNGKEKEFNTKPEFKLWLKEQNKDASDYEFTQLQEPQPVNTCYKIAKSMLADIRDKCWATKAEVYLGNGSSFREKFDLPSKYKGNRKDLVKPVHYQAVKDYLFDKMKAIEVTDIEVDDRISTRQWEGYQAWKKSQKDSDRVIACTTDKDAKSSMGWLFNWDKMNEPILIEGYGGLTRDEAGEVDGQGRAWLFYQTILGDTVDNLNPTEICKKRFGKVGAYNALVDCQTDKEAIQQVCKLYREWYINIDTPAEKVKYTTWDGREVEKAWWEIMDMYFRGVFMLRYDYEKDKPVLISEIAKGMGVFGG